MSDDGFEQPVERGVGGDDLRFFGGDAVAALQLGRRGIELDLAGQRRAATV